MSALGEDEPLSRSFHNLFVLLILTGLALWASKVVYQLVRALDLNNRLLSQQPLLLEGMSIYAQDFQMLIRQHFNQILRIQRTVPPKKLPRHALSVDLQPESVELVSSSDEPASRQSVSFRLHALAPCTVRLYWGVSVVACNELVQRRPQSTAPLEAVAPARHRRGRHSAQQSRFGLPAPLLEMEDRQEVAAASRALPNDTEEVAFQPHQCQASSRGFMLPAGLNQVFTLSEADLVDTASFNFDASAPWARNGQPVEESALVPLVVVITADRRPKSELGSVQGVATLEAQGQMSFIKFGKGSGARRLGQPEVFRQLSLGDGSTFDIQGVYGLEEEADSECVSCYSRPKNVLLLPCRHISVCHPCLRQLRDEKCPLCRAVFSSYITFPVARAHQATNTDESARRPEPAGGGDEEAPPPPPSDAQGGLAGGMLRGLGNARTLAGVGLSTTCEPVPAPREELPESSSSGSVQDCAASSAATAQPREAGASDSTNPRTRLWPRGVAPASRTTTQGFRFNGRARLSDRGDAAETPLLQEGTVTTPTSAATQLGSEPTARGADDVAAPAEQVSVSGQDGQEETSVLIRDVS